MLPFACISAIFFLSGADAIALSRRNLFQQAVFASVGPSSSVRVNADDLVQNRLFRRSKARIGEKCPISSKTESINVSVDLDPKLHLTAGARSSYQLLQNDENVISSGSFVENNVAVLSLPRALSSDLELESQVYYCDDSNACRVDRYLVPLPFVGSSELGPRFIVQRIDKPVAQ